MRLSVQLLSVAAEKSRQLLSVAACACEHEMHFRFFSLWQQVFTPRARKQQLAATGRTIIATNLKWRGM